MKSANSQESLLVALPIVFVLIILVSFLIFFPKTNTDNRTKAAPLTPTPSIVRLPNPSPTPTSEPLPPFIIPETACSATYSPVCGENGITYSNDCEANNAGTKIASKGECRQTSTLPGIRLPSTNDN